MPFNIDHIFVELILKNSVSLIREKSGILYQSQYLALLQYLILNKNLKNYLIESQFPFQLFENITPARPELKAMLFVNNFIVHH